MTRTLLALSLAVLVATSAASGRLNDLSGDSCRPLELGPAYNRHVESALRAGKDVWGNALLASREGPTYEGARRYLRPLLMARAAGGASLTASGFHYLAFSHPVGAQGSGSAALHVADGSQIISKRTRGGRQLTIGVGSAGRERYGSCVARLTLPSLAEGYLPILRTRYVDAHGVRYAQESFAFRSAEDGPLVSFLRITADARAGRGDSEIRLGPSAGGEPLAFPAPARTMASLYLGWSHSPSPGPLLTLDRLDYEAVRASAIRYWQGRLSEGATIDVPERRVRDALRNLLVQNLGLTWRYSVGNQYQQFSFPEGVDVAQVLSAYGFSAVAAAILRRSLEAPRAPYPNWRAGQKLVAAALHFRLFHDGSLVAELTPELRRAVSSMGEQIAAGRGLLQRERYSSDIPDLVHGLHSQAVAWQGLRAMSRVWSETGQRALAIKSRRLASRLEAALRRAVRTSSRTLSDGSLFIPVRLLDAERPYRAVTRSRPASYWNLVLPYALASGLFAPGSPEAEGILRYQLGHGSRMLGLVRAGAYSLYGRNAAYSRSGVNPVYGLNMARFLADNDRPDQLVLSLYGQLAAGMAPGTFVAGEAASVAPLAGERYRSMYLPPNGASNAAFLETLRLMLVHETRDRNGAPDGLELGFATPRAWLEPGQRIVVRNVPTSFGPVSFTISSHADAVDVALDVPSRNVPRRVRLRARLPDRSRILRVLLDGHELDRHGNTVDLSGRRGHIELTILVRRTPRDGNRVSG